GLHGLGAQALVRDRLHAVHPVPDHRSRRLVAADGDGDDDDAAGDNQLAVQAHLLRAGGWLAARRRQLDRKLPHRRPTARRVGLALSAVSVSLVSRGLPMLKWIDRGMAVLLALFAAGHGILGTLMSAPLMEPATVWSFAGSVAAWL